jgi:hypothetical protein
MKKIALPLFVFLILAGFIANLEAAYIIKRTAVFTARGNVTGFTKTALAATFYTRLYDSADTMATWTNIALPITGATKWKVANQYLKVTYTNYVAPWGITLATDNTNTAIANPRLTGNPSTTGGILVASNLPSSGLALAWQIQQLVTDYVPPRITDPVGNAFTNTGWAWKFMIDQGGSAFTNRAANAGTVGTSSVNYYAVPLYSGQRLWGSAAGERGATSSPVFIYLAADFSTATIQVFKTTALTLEMYKP